MKRRLTALLLASLLALAACSETPEKEGVEDMPDEAAPTAAEEIPETEP